MKSPRMSADALRLVACEACRAYCNQASFRREDDIVVESSVFMDDKRVWMLDVAFLCWREGVWRSMRVAIDDESGAMTGHQVGSRGSDPRLK